MLKCALRLRVLLGQSVIEYDFVSLNEPLAVLLAMFELLVAVTLDALQESSQG